MKIVIALVVLTALALVGTRRSFVSPQQTSSSRFSLTGSEFIIAGLLLGSDFLNLIDEQALSALQPFVCVILGWIGFLYGAQFQRAALKSIPHGFVSLSFLLALAPPVTRNHPSEFFHVGAHVHAALFQLIADDLLARSLNRLAGPLRQFGFFAFMLEI